MDNLTRQAISATLHCLTGCAIGEITGMVLGVALDWPAWITVAVSVVLAFGFGYGLALRPLLIAGLSFGKAIKTALAADTISITVMEITDNVIVVLVPGAMEAGLANSLFWTSLAASLFIAFCVTVPVNRWLIGRGLGHALTHRYHNHHQTNQETHHHDHNEPR